MVVSFIRTFILYFLIIIALRLTGKRQLGDLEPSELVVTIMISELAAVPMQDYAIPILSGIIPILTLVSLELIISCISYKSVKFRSVICVRPAVIIKDGRIIQSEMKKARLTLDELTESLRQWAVVDIKKVQYAILETNGQLSVIQKAECSPPTAKDMSVHVSEDPIPAIVINDGRLMSENLDSLGFDRSWVRTQLKSHNAKSVKDVYLLSADSKGNILFERKDSSK